MAVSFPRAESLRSTATFTGERWENGRISLARDVIATETALALSYNGKPYVVMMVTPQELEDFVLGFSLSEAIVRGPDELSGVRFRSVSDGVEADATIASVRHRELDRKQRNLTGRLGCGLCGAQLLSQAVRHPRPLADTARMTSVQLQRGMAALNARQPLNALTGAVHAAAWLSESGEVALVREDVGRHNALDKLIGGLLRDGIDPGRGAALITSRASHEMIQKAAAVGIQIVCAISAPTSLALRLADETGVSLVAFARGERHTIYTHSQRVMHAQARIAV